MTILTITFIGVILAIGVYSLLVAPKRIAVPFIIVLYIGIYIGFADLMGQSKPILVPNRELPLISFHFVEGESIHVWVLEEAPRSYRLPWNMDMAKKLREAQNGTEGGGGLMMRLGALEGEPMFYAPPPEPLPPKRQPRQW